MQIVVANSKGGCGKSTIVLALADILEAEIVDHDPQGTITISSKFTKRHKPIKPDKVSNNIVIHDTPPYNSNEFKSLFALAKYVIIPCKVGTADLLALSSVINDLRAIKAIKKAIIVFNEVRKPHNNTYKKVKEYFNKNFIDIRKAKTELSELNAFRTIMEEKIKGQARKEILELIKEIGII